MRLLIIASLISMAHAQLPDVPGVPPQPWTGPIADHQIGVHPGDTPEVAAAKAQHLAAYLDVLAVLPELPPEQRYIQQDLPLPVHHDNQQIYVEPRPVPRVHALDSVVQSVDPIASIMLAEEIPRSPIGEVPEVHAARVAHLKAVQEAKAAAVTSGFAAI